LDEQGHDDEAIRCTEQLLHHSPANEGAYRRLIRLYSRRGDYSAAMQSYHACVAALREELDVEPDAITQELYVRLVSQRAGERTEHLVTMTHQAAKLIGRVEEWHQLRRLWAARVGRPPQFALLTGEAGIGKTKLALDFGNWAARDGACTLTGHCHAGEGNLAFTPIIEMLRTPNLRRNWEQLHDVWLVELARILPDVLELRDDLPQPQPLHDSWQRQRLFEAITRCILIVQGSILIVLDDLQWADQDTLEWLHFLSRLDNLRQILVIATIRPEDIDESHPLHDLIHQLERTDQLHEIELKSLSKEESQHLIDQVSAGELTSTTVDTIVRRQEEIRYS
jgi:hypothetical protein